MIKGFFRNFAPLGYHNDVLILEADFTNFKIILERSETGGIFLELLFSYQIFVSIFALPCKFS